MYVPLLPLYHFCTHETLLKIINSKSIWLSDLSMSNDPSDGTFVGHRIAKVLEQSLGDLAYERAMDMLRVYQDHERILGTCFSTDKELVGQWTEYADSGKGAAIGFRPHRFFTLPEFKRIDLQFEFREVNYSKGEQVKAVIDFLADPEVMKAYLERDEKGLLKIAIFLFNCRATWKHEDYTDESECRLMFECPIEPFGESPRQCFNRGKPDDPILTYPLSFACAPLNIVEEVCLGPNNFADPSTIESLLKAQGYESVSVERSGIPMIR